MGAIGLALILAAAPPTEAAEPADPLASSLALQWEAPPSCPTREAVLDGIGEHLQRWEPGDVVAPATASVQVTESDGAFQASLSFSSESGTIERTFSAASCESVVQACALLVALSLEPVVVAEQVTAPKDEPERQPEPKPEPEGPQPEPQPEPEPQPDFIAHVRIEGMGQAGGVPGIPPIGAGFRGAVGFTYRAARFELVGQGTVPRLALDDGVGGRFSFGTGGIRGCSVAGRRFKVPVRLPVCAGVHGGAAVGEGVGVDVARQVVQPIVLAEVSAAVVVLPTPVLGAFVGLGVSLPLIRPAFAVDNLDTMFETSAIAVDLSLGIEFGFGRRRKPRENSVTDSPTAEE